MSASAWDRAVEAAARATVLAQSNGCCHQWPKPCLNCDCFRDQRPDVMAGYEREHARAALAAALPVLLEELAQRIEAEERLPYAMQRHVRYADVRIVRGFAAELTKKAGP